MGRATRQRSCPALRRSISASECAAGRLHAIDCPEECGFHSFAPDRYDNFLKLEARIIRMLTDGLLQEPGARRLLLDAPGVPSTVHPYVDERDEDEILARMVWLLFGETDGQGRTRARRYADALRPLLDGDGPRLLGGMIQMRAALLEVRQVLDSQTCEVIDLLDPEPRPFRVRDRGLAGAATRFLPLVCWMYPTPFLWRSHGATVVLPIMSPHEPLEIIFEIVRHLGGPTETDRLRAWLGQNLMRIASTLEDTEGARRRRVLRGMDTRFCTATYRLLRPLRECLAALDGAPDVSMEAPDPKDRAERVVAVRTILAAPSGSIRPTTLPFGEEVLGRVRFRPRACRMEVMGSERMARLRARFEALLGDKVELVRARSRDIGRRLLKSGHEPHAERVPSRLLEGAESIHLTATRVSPLDFGEPGLTMEEIRERIETGHDRLWLDLPVPALDRRTPREAAGDPGLRPRLIHLLKCRVRQFDADNLREGRTLPDLDWMLRELGADEILFPAPPSDRRAPYTPTS